MVVVATTLVSEARSKSVEGVTARPPFLAKGARSGAPVFVGEVAQRLEGYQAASVGDGDRRSGEGLLVYGFLQDGEGLGEHFVLMLEASRAAMEGWGAVIDEFMIWHKWHPLT